MRDDELRQLTGANPMKFKNARDGSRPLTAAEDGDAAFDAIFRKLPTNYFCGAHGFGQIQFSLDSMN
jgi:hypothetical protein